MACQVLEALTGVERWSEFEGRYSTTRQARRLLARHGRSFEAAGDWFFGSVNVPPRYAQRGDIVAFADQRGEKHLGVCIGAESVVLGPQGLVRVPTLKSLCAWRI
jgi:cell wall-associated NlpC family hydrolase